MVRGVLRRLSIGSPFEAPEHCTSSERVASERVAPELRNKVRLVGMFSSALALIMFSTGALGALFSLSPPLLNEIRMGLGPFYALPWLLNRWRWHRTARWLFLLQPPLALCGMALLSGGHPVSSLKVALLPMVTVPALLFGVGEPVGMAFGIACTLAALFGLDWVSAQATPIAGLPPDLFSNAAEISLNCFLALMMFVVAFAYHQVMLLRTERELRHERERSERLLENVLPAELIPALKDRHGVIAERYEDVSILFADIVGFTSLSAKLTPEELLQLLNDVFIYFDSLVGRYKLEKIKTIGDCYMVAAGVPRPCSDHAARLVRMALEVQSAMSTRTFGGHRLELRMGIHSGTVIAGVIGVTKYAFDLWGDTVNRASRLESLAAGGEIVISLETYQLVEHAFLCEERGLREAKGVGVLRAWTVLREKSASERAAGRRSADDSWGL